MFQKINLFSYLLLHLDGLNFANPLVYVSNYNDFNNYSHCK